MTNLRDEVIEAVARAEWNRKSPECEWDTDVSPVDAQKARKRARRMMKVALPLIRERLGDEIRELSRVTRPRQEGLGIERQRAYGEAEDLVRGFTYEPYLKKDQ